METLRCLAIDLYRFEIGQEGTGSFSRYQDAELNQRAFRWFAAKQHEIQTQPKPEATDKRTTPVGQNLHES